MVSRVLTKQNTIVLCLIHLSLVASYFEQRPECKDQYCGDVAISYPFGIGQNCWYDKWFEIDCKRDKGSKYMPYLKAIGLEVTVVNQNSIGALIPVNLSRYDGGFDLRESPFSFSRMENNFVGIGCNIIAYTSDSDDDINVWCTTTCDTDVIPPNFNYYHMGCRAELQQNIRRFNPVTLSAIPNGLGVSNESSAQTDASGFGLLVDELWTRQQFVTKSLPKFNKIRFVTRGKENERYVPVVMEWEFYNATPASFGVDNTTTSCETKAQWFHVNKRFYSNTSLQCSCRAGYTGNPYLSNGCQGYPDYKEKEVNWKLIVIGICSGIGVLFLVGWSYKVAKKLNHKSKKENYFKRNGGLLLKQQILSSECNIEKTKLFSSYELVKATDHFNVDRVLGQGGQGTVYKGMLSDGRIVAVKRSSIIDETKVGQFINEVVILSQINHRNVVKLLGCCLETEVPLLVYEFISNGTLFQHIHNPTEDFPLTWTARLRIAAEIAGALAYMHSAASMPIYHRDIKSTNILLDDKYKAKVADFGTSKSIDVDKTHFTTLVQGTFGYLDPEYFRSSQFTEKSDVYSFGVVLVELLTGRKPIFSNSLQEIKGLALHFFETMEQNNLLEMIDPQILKEGKIEEMTAVAHLAKTCLHMNGKRRPTMKEVAVQLEGIRMSEGNYNPHNNYEKVIEETEIEIEVAEGFHDSSASTGTW